MDTQEQTINDVVLLMRYGEEYSSNKWSFEGRNSIYREMETKMMCNWTSIVCEYNSLNKKTFFSPLAHAMLGASKLMYDPRFENKTFREIDSLLRCPPLIKNQRLMQERFELVDFWIQEKVLN